MGPSRYLDHVVFIDMASGPGLRLRPASLIGALSGWLMWQPTRQVHQLEGTSIDNYSRFSFGAGLRLTQLRTGRSDQFDGRDNAKGLTLQVNAPQLTALNAAIHLRLRLLGKRHPLAMGFNIDLAGISFGPARSALLPLSVPPRFAYDIRPVRANLLLGNKNDRGTLNSEFYLAYKASPRLTMRAGWAHVASGYAHGGNRYQRFTNLAVVGLSIGVGSGWRYY